jgi:hypothetical protein
LHNNLKKHLANAILNAYIKFFELEIIFLIRRPKLRNCQSQGCKRNEIKKKLYNTDFCGKKKREKLSERKREKKIKKD